MNSYTFFNKGDLKKQVAEKKDKPSQLPLSISAASLKSPTLSQYQAFKKNHATPGTLNSPYQSSHYYNLKVPGLVDRQVSQVKKNLKAHFMQVRLDKQSKSESNNHIQARMKENISRFKFVTKDSPAKRHSLECKAETLNKDLGIKILESNQSMGKLKLETEESAASQNNDPFVKQQRESI